jgi:hypothetical protein
MNVGCHSGMVLTFLTLFSYNIVTYVRFPWLNNVNVAVTIDSAELLQFRSNATIKQILRGRREA